MPNQRAGRVPKSVLIHIENGKPCCVCGPNTVAGADEEIVRYVLPPASPLAKAEAAALRESMRYWQFGTQPNFLRYIRACNALFQLRRSSLNSRRDKGRGRK